MQGVSAGFFDMALSLLDAWVGQCAQAQPNASAAPQEIPRWIDALLLCLDMAMQPQPTSAAQLLAEQPQGPSATPATTATPASAAPNSAAAGGTASDAASTSTAQLAASEAQAPAVQKKSAEERQQTAIHMLKESIRTMFMPNGLLSQHQLEQAASICLKLLRHLHLWGSVWKVPEADNDDLRGFARPEPAASTQAVVQVLARVTKSHKVALKVSLTSYACVFMNNVEQTSHAYVLRNFRLMCIIAHDQALC